MHSIYKFNLCSHLPGKTLEAQRSQRLKDFRNKDTGGRCSPIPTKWVDMRFYRSLETSHDTISELECESKDDITRHVFV